LADKQSPLTVSNADKTNQVTKAFILVLIMLISVNCIKAAQRHLISRVKEYNSFNNKVKWQINAVILQYYLKSKVNLQ
jgi:hypothetical protein